MRKTNRWWRSTILQKKEGRKKQTLVQREKECLGTNVKVSQVFGKQGVSN